MKLMLLTEYYPPKTGAASVRIAEMVKHFSKQKDIEHISVVVFDHEQRLRNPIEHTELSGKVDTIYYGKKLSPKFLHRAPGLNPFTLACWILLSIKEAKKWSPDIVIATVPSHFNPAIAAYIVSVVCKKGFCIDIRDFWVGIYDYSLKSRSFYIAFLIKFVEKVMLALFLRSCRKALLISTVYPPIRDYLIKEAKLKTPVVLVPNGINFSEIEEVKKDFDRSEILSKNGIVVHHQGLKFIIYSGVIGEYYRPDVLLKPLKKMIERGNNVGYILVGQGKAEESIAKVAANMGIENYVFRLGERSHSQVIELLLAADVAFYALDGNFPNPDCALGSKVLEYIACMLPIMSITGEGSIVSELISKHKIGIALKWNDTTQIENALEELLGCKEFRENINKFYPTFKEEFNREKVNRKLYQEMKYKYLKKGWDID